MLISEFAAATGLTPDTIRFYVRRGLLDPSIGAKGGRNPYQMFRDEHVYTAELIRLGQSLGMSLREIGVLLTDARSGRLGPDEALVMAADQRDRLRRKAADLSALADYLDAKIAWLRAGSTGAAPSFPRLPTDGPDRPTTLSANCLVTIRSVDTKPRARKPTSSADLRGPD